MQQQLFGAPATRGASRRSDPQTSRDAARSMSGEVLRDQQALILGALSWHEDATGPGIESLTLQAKVSGRTRKEPGTSLQDAPAPATEVHDGR